MPRRPAKERTAMSVAVLASLAFVLAAVFVYDMPGETVGRYLLMIVVLLALVMFAALLLVGLRVLIKKLAKRS
jgi:peptidoglycan/LPS O-acetylase OafA/YrhL